MSDYDKPMEDKKQINIDPAMLDILTKTRRKEPKVPKEKIPKLKLRNVDHTIKSHALKFIRNKQQSMYDDYNSTPPSNTKIKPIVPDSFKSDFESSINYLNTVNSNKPAVALIHKTPPVQNHTFRQPQPHPLYSYATPVSISPEIDETNIDIEAPKDVFDTATPVKVSMPTPKYGCMKNGTLPTYRTYSKTLRNTPDSEQDRKWNLEPSFSEWMKKNSEMRKIHERAETQKAQKIQQNKAIHMNRRKLKKTIRHTYVVGRSAVQPKVSVLVSNRTIRRDIGIKCNQLKQSPLEDVKRELIKKGFIKVGTNAPPDVLRKMYESINTMCGDIKNHNSENLVYNYFNDEENK